jgi:hypothetical protein
MDDLRQTPAGRRGGFGRQRIHSEELAFPDLEIGNARIACLPPLPRNEHRHMIARRLCPVEVQAEKLGRRRLGDPAFLVEFAGCRLRRGLGGSTPRPGKCQPGA